MWFAEDAVLAECRTLEARRANADLRLPTTPSVGPSAWCIDSYEYHPPKYVLESDGNFQHARHEPRRWVNDLFAQELDVMDHGSLALPEGQRQRVSGTGDCVPSSSTLYYILKRVYALG